MGADKMRPAIARLGSIARTFTTTTALLHTRTLASMSTAQPLKLYSLATPNGVKGA